MDKTWRPLSVRDGGNSARYDALHEGVPVWLRASLREWVEDQVYVDGYSGKTLSLEILQAVERAVRLDIFVGEREDQYSARTKLLDLAGTDEEAFLDAVDFLLHSVADVTEAGRLEYFLEQGGSAWRVTQAGDKYALERRVAEAAADAAALAGEAGRAGQMLQRAWHAAYGRNPDPSTAYREAVRAVEAAAQPIITPKDSKATLGKMNAALRAAPERFRLVLSPTDSDGVPKMLGMMELLWEAQHDRHGDPSNDKPLTVRARK